MHVKASLREHSFLALQLGPLLVGLQHAAVDPVVQSPTLTRYETLFTIETLEKHRQLIVRQRRDLVDLCRVTHTSGYRRFWPPACPPIAVRWPRQGESAKRAGCATLCPTRSGTGRRTKPRVSSGVGRTERSGLPTATRRAPGSAARKRTRTGEVIEFCPECRQREFASSAGWRGRRRCGVRGVCEARSRSADPQSFRHRLQARARCATCSSTP